MWLTCAALMAGCSEPAPRPIELVSVEGTVTRNGKPVPRAIVTFFPVDKKGTPARGITNSKGHFELMHQSQTPGAEAGEYKVVVLDRMRIPGKPALDTEPIQFEALVQDAPAKFDFEIPEASSK